MRNRVLSRVAIFGFALTIPMNALPAAYAAPENQPHSTTQAVDEEQRQQTLIKEARDLEASDIPRHTVTQDGEDFLVYELNTGVNLAMPAALTRPSPYVSAGPALRGPWIELTSTEQKMVAGGTIGFITVAICGGTFGLACGTASAIAGAALAYIGDKGVCPNNKRMLIEYTWGITVRGAQCR